MWDLAALRQHARGPLPLTPGAQLGWLGFTELRALAAADSAGWVRVRREELGREGAVLFRFPVSEA